MDLDDQLHRYFGTADLAAAAPETVRAGTEEMQADFEAEQDPHRRFPLWAMMHLLGVAPPLDAAFTDERDREHARGFQDMLAGFDRPE